MVLLKQMKFSLLIHIKGTKPANMPRPSRKRGKQVKKRGISNEQVCVVHSS